MYSLIVCHNRKIKKRAAARFSRIKQLANATAMP